MFKKFLILSLIFLSGFALFATGQQDASETMESSKGEKIILLHDKSGSPNWQPFFEEMAGNIKGSTEHELVPSSYPSTDVYIAQVRSSMITKDAPGMFTWWSTYRMEGMANQNVLGDLSPVWDKHMDEYSQDMRAAFTFNDKAHGFPISVEYWPVWYNKEVFADLNLTVPETWEEFTNVCDTMLANDITPMMSTIEGRWPTFIMFEEMIIGQDPDLYVDLCEGRVKYSDPRIRKAFEIWGEMIEKGYFTDPGTDIWAGGARDFNQKKVGMALMGTWYLNSTLTPNGVPEENVGAFILPSHNASAGKNVILEITPILTSRNAENQDAIAEAVDYWMSPEGNGAFAKLLNTYPANPKADVSHLSPIKVEIADTINNGGYRVLNRYWEATPTPICEVAVDQFAKFAIDPSSLDEVLKELDKVADAHWASTK
jgi:ABC-type glycerol-3-phosphate transport system substrate-binding protein